MHAVRGERERYRPLQSRIAEGSDPVHVARAVRERFGLGELYVADLDAIAGGRGSPDVVAALAREVRVMLDAGAATAPAVGRLLELGVARVVIGTAALKDPQFVRDMAREWENGIVVAVDAKGGMVATEGWAEVSNVPVTEMARRFEDAGVASLLFTDIGRDGLLKGCNIDATVDLARRTDLPVIASGGVKGLDDIRMLAIHADEGIEGVITGRALYDGRLDLAAAIAMANRT